MITPAELEVLIDPKPLEDSIDLLIRKKVELEKSYKSVDIRTIDLLEWHETIWDDYLYPKYKEYWDVYVARVDGNISKLTFEPKVVHPELNTPRN